MNKPKHIYRAWCNTPLGVVYFFGYTEQDTRAALRAKLGGYLERSKITVDRYVLETTRETTDAQH